MFLSYRVSIWVLPQHVGDGSRFLAPGIPTEALLLVLDTFVPGWGRTADGRGLKRVPPPPVIPWGMLCNGAVDQIPGSVQDKALWVRFSLLYGTLFSWIVQLGFRRGLGLFWFTIQTVLCRFFPSVPFFDNFLDAE